MPIISRDVVDAQRASTWTAALETTTAGPFCTTDCSGRVAPGGTWTRDRLLAFLADPDGFAAGTIMPNPEIGDPAVRAALVDVLQALKEQPE